MPLREGGALTSVKPGPDVDTERSAGLDLLRQPVAIAAGAASALALVLFNIYAFILGDRAPWLLGGILIADMVVVATGIAVAVREVRRTREITQQAEETVARTRGELEASEARLARIVDSAMDAIITVDEGQNIVLFNRAAEQVFGCRREGGGGGERSAPRPHRGFGDGRDHHGRRGTEHRALQPRSRTGVRLPQGGGDRPPAPPLHPPPVPRGAPRPRRALRQDRRHQPAHGRRDDPVGIERRRREGIPDRGLDLADPRAAAALLHP